MELNRETAYRVLTAVETRDAYSNIELNNRIDDLKPSHPGFVRELVYGVLERKYTLDYYLDQMLKKGVSGLDQEVLTILRMGTYQISYMDSVPDHGAVSQSVELAKRHKRPAAGLVNGVLRNYIRNRNRFRQPEDIEDLKNRYATVYSYEPWIVELFMDQYGDRDAEVILKAGNSRPPLVVRVNTTKTDPGELSERLSKQGFTVDQSPISPRALRIKGGGLLSTEEYAEGLFSVQDESSIAMMDEVAPAEGSTVIDVCAAPGGKSLSAAESMKGKGRVISMDVYENKLDMIMRRSRTLGLENVDVSCRDALDPREELFGTGDLVICDVPCSGLGVVRRRPEIKYKPGPDMTSLTEKQYAILRNSCRYVKPGGRLVYSTCTINRKENEDTVERFLSENSNFHLTYKKKDLPGREDTDGFFYAIMDNHQ